MQRPRVSTSSTDCCRVTLALTHSLTLLARSPSSPDHLVLYRPPCLVRRYNRSSIFGSFIWLFVLGSFCLFSHLVPPANTRKRLNIASSVLSFFMWCTPWCHHSCRSSLPSSTLQCSFGIQLTLEASISHNKILYCLKFCTSLTVWISSFFGFALNYHSRWYEERNRWLNNEYRQFCVGESLIPELKLKLDLIR